MIGRKTLPSFRLLGAIPWAFHMKTFLPAVVVALFGALSFIPTGHTEEPAKPTGAEIKDLKETVADVPHDLLVALLSNTGKQAAASKTTDLLRSKVEGRMATLKFKIDKIEKEHRATGEPDGYRIKAEDGHVRAGATAFKVYLWIHFSLTENAKLDALRKGNDLTVTGKITVASATAQGVPELHIDLSDATVN